MSEPFLPTLKKKGVIDHAVFSMFINSGDEQNKLTLGGYNTEKFGMPGSNLNWHELSSPGKSSWITSLSDEPAFGGVKLENSGITDVLVDSGASVVIFPEPMRAFMYEEINKILGIHDFFPGLAQLDSFTCTDADVAKLPAVNLAIGGIDYSIPPQSYIKKFGDMCSIANMKKDSYPNQISLGLNFMENYYTVFDIDNGRIGFIDSVNSKNLKYEPGLYLQAQKMWNLMSVLSPEQVQSGLADYQTPLLVCLVFSFWAIAFVAAAKCMSRKKASA